MEKSSIFCNSCPVLNRCPSFEEEKPVGIGGTASRVNRTTALHHLSSPDPAARFRMVNSNGDVIKYRTATVVAPAGLTNDEVSAYFEACDEPNDNEFSVGIKQFRVSFKLGKSCAALMAIELGAEHAPSRLRTDK